MIYQVTHLIPQYEYLCDWKGKVLVDFVGRFESLDRDVKKLSKILSKEIKLNHLNKSSKLDYTDVYTDQMIKEVKNIYKNDLRIFNYSFFVTSLFPDNKYHHSKNDFDEIYSLVPRRRRCGVVIFFFFFNNNNNPFFFIYSKKK